MPAPPANPIYGTQCAPVFGNTYDTCGGSFSRAQLTTLSESGIKDLFTDTARTKFHEVEYVLKHQFDMLTCGIKRNGFYEWITSSNRPGMSNLLSWEKRDRGPMILRPFILGRQQSVVNTDYYTILNGYVPVRGAGVTDPDRQYPTDTTANPLSANAIAITNAAGANGRIIRVVNGYGAGNLLDAGRFLADMSVAPGAAVPGGHALYILNTGAASKALMTQWRIVEAANDPNGTFVDVAIIQFGDPAITTIDLKPVKGVVVNGINNVADVEQYCKNPTNYTNVKFVPFWFQTYRETRCVDSEYLKVQRQLLNSNEFFKIFVDLPEAERNRQDEERSQREFVHSFLFGAPYEANQTKDNWGSLPNITSVAQGKALDPGVGTKLWAKRANMIGVYHQLRQCGQVHDKSGLPLNLTEYLETNIYNLYRARQSRGSKSARNIVVWTDTTTANDFMAAWIKYAQKKTGLTTATLTWNAEEMDRNDPKALLGFTWRTYKLFKPSGVTLEIVTHETFDDMKDVFIAADAASPYRGKYLLALDIGSGGTIHPATLASNRKTYTVGDLDQMAKIDITYSCVMEAPTQVKTLTSKTVTTIVSCPLENLWTENFSTIDVP